MSHCPCGSGCAFVDCCQPYLLGNQLPATAEALMRSRYTAYSQANMAYIINTMRGPALENFDAQQAQQWAQTVVWQKLVVVKATQESADKAYVEFIVSYLLNQRRQIIHESSEFQRIDGRWYYIQGVTPNISRNAPCSCGSGKKAKRCCFAAI